MSDALTGTGQIRDESGRCVVVQQPAGVTVPYGPTPATVFGIVVLDVCNGDNAQWTAKTSGSITTYQNGIETPPTKCWLLNVVGDSPDVKQCEVAVWGFNLPCSSAPQSNSEFTWVPENRQLKIISSDRVAKNCPDSANCCLKATPCVSPCVLPTSWGAVFLIFIGVACGVYLAGGIGWAVKTQGVSPSLHAHPHISHWTSFGGLVADGAIFFKARVDAYRGQPSHQQYDRVGEATPPKSPKPETAGEEAVDQEPTNVAAPGDGSNSDDELVE